MFSYIRNQRLKTPAHRPRYSYTKTVLSFCLLLTLHTAFADQAFEDDRISGIKGFDNRRTVNGSHPPWQAIGKIDTAGLFLCTGVLIDPIHVLTAAHCIWNKNTNKAIKPQHLGFVAGYHREQYMVEKAIKRVTHSPHYTFQYDSKPSLRNFNLDWAILELASPINNIKPIPLSNLATQDLLLTKKHTRITQVGFSGDRAYILTADPQCKITKHYKNAELIGHNCDATKGDSGSPLLIKIQGELKIAALHVGRQTFSDKTSVGVAITTPSFTK